MKIIDCYLQNIRVVANYLFINAFKEGERSVAPYLIRALSFTPDPTNNTRYNANYEKNDPSYVRGL
jgi:hypothetical protein